MQAGASAAQRNKQQLDRDVSCERRRTFVDRDIDLDVDLDVDRHAVVSSQVVASSSSSLVAQVRRRCSRSPS